MASTDTQAQLRLLRETALSVLLGKEKVPYEPNQFNSLAIDVADVLARRGTVSKQSWVSMGGSDAQLQQEDEELLREVLNDLVREGILLEGLNSANPRWPFFRLTNLANEILAKQNATVSVSTTIQTAALREQPPREEGTGSMTEQQSPPKVFVSYSWDDEPHKSWTRDFATRLRKDGVDVTIDQWAVVPGDRLPHFMERAIGENSYVLIVCTPKYKSKSDNRQGGVGYEGDIMTAEVYAQGNHRKFIPILRSGDWKTAIPSWLSGKYSIDLSAAPFSEDQYLDLLATLHNQRDQAPPLGPTPNRANLNRATPIPIREAVKPFLRTQEKTEGEFEPIRVLGVLADEVGEPLNDGTLGSALYAVPFKLSRAPTSEWSEMFIRTWDRPPQSTTRHRTGIARVQGDHIVLTGTTIEEVQEIHRDTFKLVVDTVNTRIAEVVKKRHAAEQTKANEQIEHKEKVRRIAGDVKFD